MASSDMSPLCRLIAVRLAFHYNLTSGRCDPSINRLATGVDCTSRAVEQAISVLEKGGWLSRESSRGRHPNRYQLRMERVRAPAADPAGDSPDECSTPNECSGSIASNPERRFAATPNDGSAQPRTAVRANRELNKKMEQGEDSPPSPSHVHRLHIDPVPGAPEPSRWEEFWNACPRHAAAGLALSFYKQIVMSGTATEDELITCMKRYAAERQGEDMQFTKKPVNWLREECWKDAPVIKLGAPKVPLNGRSAAVSFLDMAAKRMARR